jgi:hypothetical protein
MLHLPREPAAEQTSLLLQTQRRLRGYYRYSRDGIRLSQKQVAARLEEILAAAQQVYSQVQEKSSQIIAHSRQNLAAVQVLLLFVFMPQEFVRDLMFLVRLAADYLAKDHPLIAGFTRKFLPNSEKKAAAGDQSKASYEMEIDLPGMVKLASSHSFSTMEDSSATLGLEVV